MSIWKRTMEYLGLGPDDAYFDDDAYEPEPRRTRTAPETGRVTRPGDFDPEPPVRTIPARPTFPSRDTESGTIRRPVTSDDSGVVVRPLSSARSRAAAGEPHKVSPRRFEDAQEIADRFKEGYSVIINFEGTDREVSRRLIDFASGLCYALGGTMEKVATGVYLIKPLGRDAGD